MPSSLSSSSSSPAVESNATFENFSSLNGSRDVAQDEQEYGSQVLQRAWKKDTRSFTQSLFDTVALQMYEWLPLRGGRISGRNGKASEAAAATYPPFDRRASISQTNNGPSRPEKNGLDGKGFADNVNSIPSAFHMKVANSGQSYRRRSSSQFDRDHNASALGDAREYTSGAVPPSHHTSPSSPSVGGKVASVDQTDSDKRKRRVSFHDEITSLKHSNPPRPGNGLHDTVNDVTTLTKTDSYHDKSTVKCLDRLTGHLIWALRIIMFKTRNDEARWLDELDNLENHPYRGLGNFLYANRRQREMFPFIAQSVFFTLSSPKQLLKSFSTSSKAPGSRGRNLDVASLDSSFRMLNELCPWDISIHSIWLSLEKLFIMPEELVSHTHHSRRTLRRANSSSSSTRPANPSADGNNYRPEDYISNHDAAHICFLALHFLISTIPSMDSHTWQHLHRLRSSGKVIPDETLRKISPSKAECIVSAADKFEHDLALRLGIRLARVISARAAFHEISKARQMGFSGVNKRDKASVNDIIIEYIRSCCPEKPSRSSGDFSTLDQPGERSPHAAMVAVEWLRTVLLKQWDGNPEITRSSAAGGALQLMTSLYQHRLSLGLIPKDFHTPFLRDRLDPMDMPAEWLSKTSNNQTIHLLSCSFLFPPSALVHYFRAMNYSVMSKFYETALSHERHWKTIEVASTVAVSPDDAQRMHTATQSYLLIVVRREDVLRDALDQLWKREKRELMRPLKVIMGMHEGEEGVDHGGVQQEFFRVALIEALNPDFGVFTVSDAHNYSSWFQPGCLEPLYKFELLGLLVSLAVYNGLTLAVNFPLALYMKLLDIKVKTTDDIRVGWPELARGFDELLAWDDGDVGDMFMRTYEFSYEECGSVVDIDMLKYGRERAPPATQRVLAGRRASAYGSRSRSPEHVLSSVKDTHPCRRGSISWDGDANGNINPSIPGRLSRTDITGRVSGILKSSSAQSPVSVPLSHENLSAKEDQELAETPLHANGKRERWDSAGTEQEGEGETETETEQGQEEDGEEAALVTNENREQYVKDYIFWLTDKSIRPQYEAFARGFYTCLDRTALSIFTPEALKKVVEGTQLIDIDELLLHARYSGDFSLLHPSIIDFWSIARQFSQEKRRALLEFVTASDRVPVNGISSITFVIQNNGVGDTVSPNNSPFP